MSLSVTVLEILCVQGNIKAFGDKAEDLISSVMGNILANRTPVDTCSDNGGSSSTGDVLMFESHLSMCVSV